MYLQTNEEKVGVTIDVGQILLLIKTQNNDGSNSEDVSSTSEETLLCKVVQVERLQQEKLNVRLEIISSDISHIKIDNDSSKELLSLLAISNKRPVLITNIRKDYWATAAKTNQTIEIFFPDKTATVIKIAALQSISQAVQIFSLH